ncbi:hypothetical protein L1987_07116 [Smallanthus sonchifolius]|uniref:Uncharacterized protein n=1 Tax=Smallanthus sonchifolius TaxID=185202 RepID=A0ACB9JZZ6_9ASTR|nr:hypothetical protein L1987_07116 [Smallanthus sonchifolius]
MPRWDASLLVHPRKKSEMMATGGDERWISGSGKRSLCREEGWEERRGSRSGRLAADMMTVMVRPRRRRRWVRSSKGMIWPEAGKGRLVNTMESETNKVDAWKPNVCVKMSEVMAYDSLKVKKRKMV